MMASGFGVALFFGVIFLIISVVAYYLTGYVACLLSECCSARWISFDPKNFRAELDKKLYGQPYAESTVEALRQHFANPTPSKALAISLHGPAGTGKNYFAAILRDHIFKMTDATNFFHILSATAHFADPSRTSEYQETIKKRIKDAVQDCKHSVFVFDEVEKMPFTLMDTLKPFLDHHARIDGVDYRNSVFLFLSNDGAELIMNKTLQVKRQQQERERIPLAEFDRLLSVDLFEKGGFAQSSVIGSHLISRFVPFLPLEKRHVRWCIQDELWRQGHEASEAFVDRILSHIQFVPKKEKFFASYGCKRVPDKVAMVLEEAKVLKKPA